MKHFATLVLMVLAFSFGANAQCTPDVTLTQPGFYPSPDSLPCVERGVAFDTVIQFKNFSTVNAQDFGIPFPITVTVNWIRIDNISGLPNGLSYACNPSNCTINGGDNGCIEISGTTNDPTGKYDLLIHATINADVPGFGTIEEQGTSEDLGFELFLSVINAGEPCPLPSVTLANGPVFSCPGQGAPIQLSVDTGGAFAPFTYEWSPATGLSDANIANPVATVTATTIYTVTVTDANGFEFTTTVEVGVDNTPAPDADFNFVVTGSQVVFTNLSSNGTSVSWNFGNGSNSVLANPTFTYDSIADYEVTLIVNNNCGADTITKTVTTTGISNILGQELSVNVFPNPTKGIFTVSLNGVAATAAEVMVYDLQGRKINTAMLQSNGFTMNAVLDLSTTGSGIYIVKILSGGQTSTHKLVVH